MTTMYHPNAEMQGSSVEKLWPPESIQLSFKFQALEFDHLLVDKSLGFSGP